MLESFMEKCKRYSTLYESGWLTMNECRILSGLEPIGPSGDSLVITADKLNSHYTDNQTPPHSTK